MTKDVAGGRINHKAGGGCEEREELTERMCRSSPEARVILSRRGSGVEIQEKQTKLILIRVVNARRKKSR